MIGDILQPTHLLFVLVVALLVLGPKRLPEVGRSLGKGLRDFKIAMSGEDDERPESLGSPVASTTAAASATSDTTSTAQTAEPSEPVQQAP